MGSLRQRKGTIDSIAKWAGLTRDHSLFIYIMSVGWSTPVHGTGYQSQGCALSAVTSPLICRGHVVLSTSQTVSSREPGRLDTPRGLPVPPTSHSPISA